MMYRDDSKKPAREVRRRGYRTSKKGVLFVAVVCIAAVSIMLFSFAGSHHDEVEFEHGISSPTTNDDQSLVYRKRIKREVIPHVDFRGLNLRELFNDSNYVHLSAARANGIDPDKLKDPSESEELVQIFSSDLYRVDSMYHSTPYLVPEAVLLLNYIAERFESLMDEHYSKHGKYKIIVTSALRTEQSERHLRRVNRNATDTSCHIYGTTFDISAQRYEHVASGHDTVVDMCKQMLALALYEIKYEGLCFVKYERGSCFHITLRTTQYEGSQASEELSYVCPGSPVYQHTKSPARPKARKNVATKHNTISNNTKRTPKHNNASNKKTETKANSKKKESIAIRQPNNNITERERLSLEQIERRY